MEERYEIKIPKDHMILTSLVKYAGLALNVGSAGDDGKTAYERRKGKKFIKVLPEFAENILWMQSERPGDDKLESKWKDGVYVGLRMRSGELLVATEDSIVKARSWCRKPEAERWNKEALSKIKGVPWEPVPGQGRTQIKSRITIRDQPIPDSELPEVELRPGKALGIWITKREVMKYGITPGCAGCVAQNRGRTGVAHNAKCRERMEEMMQEHEPDKYNKAVTRMLESKLRETEPEAKMEVDSAPAPRMEVDTAPAQSQEVQESSEERDTKRRKMVEREAQLKEDEW